jgi:hypothetical protein
MSSENRVRTTLSLDAEVLGAARLLAAARAVSLGQVMSELARRGLQATIQPAYRRGFPIFVVAETAAPLTLEQINQERDGE